MIGSDFSPSQIRLLTQHLLDDTAKIIVVVVGIILLALAVGCFCWKRRRGAEQVEFQIFSNEPSAPTSKDARNNASGTVEVIGFDPNQIGSSKDEEDINTTSESKKKRRRKKDRIQQRSMQKQEEDPQLVSDEFKRDPDESFDIQ